MEEGAKNLRCALCNYHNPSLECEECQCIVCEGCLMKHLSSDVFIDHKVIPYQKQGTIPKSLKCQSHLTELCEFHCQRCDKPVCKTCLLSNSHKGHTLTELTDVIRSKEEVIEKDFEEMQQSPCCCGII